MSSSMLPTVKKVLLRGPMARGSGSFTMAANTWWRRHCLIHHNPASPVALSHHLRRVTAPLPLNADSQLVSFKGQVTNVISYTWGSVARVKEHRDNSNVKEHQDKSNVKEHRDKSNVDVKVIGSMTGLKPGMTVEFHGTWRHHSIFGEQFNASNFCIQERQGIAAFLPHVLPNVGEELANRIVETFGEDTVDVISGKGSTKRLEAVKGIGKKIAAAIQKTWQEQPSAVLLDVMTRFCPYGVSPNKCKLIVEFYGSDVLALIKSDPYRLCRDVDTEFPFRLTFDTADSIALAMGVHADSLLRIDACLDFVMKKEVTARGHTAIRIPQLIGKISGKIKLNKTDVIRDRIYHLGHAGPIIVSNYNGLAYAQHPYFAKAEAIISDFINRAAVKSPLVVDLETIKTAVGLKFNNDQVDAINRALSNRVSVITGGPGTGKTAICRELIKVLEAKKPSKVICLAAPTGKAANNLSNTTEREATTIHRLLESNDNGTAFKWNEDNKLDADFLIVDEVSMLDTYLASHLMRALPEHCHLVLLGDVDQLPSVGAGNVLDDIIRSKRVMVTRLKTIYRQEDKSAIVTYAHAINAGDYYLDEELLCSKVSDLSTEKQFQFLDLRGGDCLSVVADILTNFVKKRLKRNPIDDVQVLSPMKKGPAGTPFLNKILQQELNHNQSDTFTLRGKEDVELRVGDKVMQTKNDYKNDIFNGTVGFVETIDEGVVAVDFDGTHVKKGHDEANVDPRIAVVNFDGTRVKYSYHRPKLDNLTLAHPDHLTLANPDHLTLTNPNHLTLADPDHLTLAYATTVHKSQGSEYPIVIIVLTMDHKFLLQRKVVYTAFTRSKEKVILVGDLEAYEEAVQNDRTEPRCTLLYHRLSEEKHASESTLGNSNNVCSLQD